MEELINRQAVLESVKRKETLYDAFRYVFQSMNDSQFERYLILSGLQVDIRSSGYAHILSRHDNAGYLNSICVDSICGVDFSGDFNRRDPETWLLISIRLANFDEVNVEIPYMSPHSIPCSTLNTMRSLGNMLESADRTLNLVYTICFRMQSYLWSLGVFTFGISGGMESSTEYILTELSKDIQTYHRDDVLKGAMKQIGSSELIDLCAKYNLPELQMYIVHLTQYEDKTETDFRL